MWEMAISYSEIPHPRKRRARARVCVWMITVGAGGTF